MTKQTILLAAGLALAGCATNPHEDALHRGTPAPAAAVIGLETTYGQSLPPRSAPGAQMPGTTGGPAIPAPSSPTSETSTGAAQQQHPQTAPQIAAGQPGNSQPALEPTPQMEAAKSATDRPAELPAGEPQPTGAAPNPGINAMEQVITQSVTNAFVTAGIPSETLANVNVRTTNGRVILSGQVKTLQEKEQLEMEARNIPGVKTVISQLRIVPDPNEATDQTATGLGTPGRSSQGAGSGSQAR